MDNLYKPTKNDCKALNLGTKKIRIHNLKADNLIADALCPQCKAPVYKLTTKPGYLTLNGSKHIHKSNFN